MSEQDQVEHMPFPASVQAAIQERMERPAAGQIRNPKLEKALAERGLPPMAARTPVSPVAAAVASTMSSSLVTEAPTVPNIEHVPVNPIADASSVSMPLPSRFAYYPFKDLYVRPFKLQHMGKLNKAHEDASILHMVEAVSSVIHTTAGIPALGFDLCVADFYAVLYWLRLHSFVSNSLLHKTACLNPSHIERVAKQELAQDTLRLEQVVKETELQVIELTEVPDPEKFRLDAPGWFLRPQTMRDTLEFWNHPAHLDADFQYMAKLAANLGKVDAEGNVIHVPLADRIEAINDWSPEQGALIQQFEKLVDGFGIDETVNITCKWCGASRKSKIILDAHSFLSASRG